MMKITKTLLGLVMLGAASAASAGIYECNFNANYSQFTCSTYTLGFEPPTPILPPSSCPSYDSSKVIVIDTNVSAGYYPRTDFNNVAKETIYAFKFKTASAADTGRWSAAKLTIGSGKTLKITQCPGVLETTNTTGSCDVSSSEATTVNYAVNRPDLTRGYCQLQPNTVYYVNAISRENSTSSVYNCTSGTNCGFSMQGE